jgi:predicted TPR repeat methyltransferase
MSAETHLANVYKVAHGDAMRAYYDRWAEGYETELLANGYATPLRAAEALARHLPDKAAPVLDFACGTGLAGAALAAQGFTAVDGMDISAAMLEQARRKSVYRNLVQAKADRPFDLEGATYAAIVSSGGIGTGAAPATFIDAIIDQLAPGGRFVLSLNDRSIADDDYGGRVTRAAEDGRIEILENIDGPHLPGLGLRARVFVLGRS